MNKKGFTLVELMIVIAIIGILAAIFIPFIVMYFSGDKFGGVGTSKIVEYPQPPKENIIQVEPVEEPSSAELGNISCVDGKKVIKINGKDFYLGTIKNSWGDLESVKCQ